MIISVEEFLSLRDQFPLIDVRSELEYEAGHMNGAVNIPILNNEERKKVGTLYKQSGKEAAIKEGIRLVGPRLHEIVTQAEQVANKRPLLVHCWRGGMRSNNFCWLIERLGLKTFALRGGYKAYRQNIYEVFQKPMNLIVLSGSTGSGKTKVLKLLKTKGEQVIDLEELANHKGSVFGGIGKGRQPTTEQFQNDLFETILPLDVTKRIWVEDESAAIGKVYIPDSFWRRLRDAPIFKMNVSKAMRIKNLVEGYGAQETDHLLASIRKIEKRLGGQHAKAATEKLVAGDLAATADILLTYYDKAYDHGFKGRDQKLVATVHADTNEIETVVNDLIQEADRFQKTSLME